MTEGIIQKVFNRLDKLHTSYQETAQDSNTFYRHQEIKNNLLHMKQELIAEIKKEFEQYPYYNYNSRDNRTYVLRIPDIISKLIGDIE